MAIIEKATIIGNIMGGNSLGHGQSFVSDNRTIRKHLTKAEEIAKENPEQLKPITDLINKALDQDEKIQQNLILKLRNW